MLGHAVGEQFEGRPLIHHGAQVSVAPAGVVAVYLGLVKVTEGAARPLLAVLGVYLEAGLGVLPHVVGDLRQKEQRESVSTFLGVADEHGRVLGNR